MKYGLFGVVGVALFILFGNFSSVFAATEVSGVIAQDTVWTAASSPYIVVDKITVAQGATLTLEKGTVVKLSKARVITVNGGLQVEGTEAEPVYITSQTDDSVGGDSNNNGAQTVPAPGDWQGLYFNAGAVGTFDHVVIRYTGFFSSPTVKQISSIHNLGATIAITNSEFTKSTTCAVGQTSGSLRMENTTMNNLYCGVIANGGDVALLNNTVANNTLGFFAKGLKNIELVDNTFENNKTNIEITLTRLELFVHSGNTASGSTQDGNGLVVRGTVTSDMNFTNDSLPYLIVAGGGSAGAGGLPLERESSLFVNATSTLTIDPGAVVKFHQGGRMVVSGELHALGTQESPIFFTSIKDDSVGGDTNNDSSISIPEAGNWRQIEFGPGSVGTFDHTALRYGGYLSSSGSYGTNIYNSGGTLTIENSELSYGKLYGLWQISGVTAISDSNIHDNVQYGVLNDSPATLDARNNYWGDPTGPSHATNLTGLGDTVSDKVLYSPWKGTYCTENCNSSVLFLPGIMGSRLYEESDACGTVTDERERWMSTTDCEQLRLLTNVQGNSINSIYTKEGKDSVIDEALGVFNLYKTFLNTLDDWKEDGIIKDYVAVPYDWRLRLDDILKTKKDATTGKITYDANIPVTESYLYQTITELAANSSTGKVTIVAHSNGGLLAKAFLATLQNNNDPLAQKVDVLILVGSPQLGTPSTLLGMLQGDVIGPAGTIVSQQTTRQLMNTMPFGFHLLPNASYFNSSGVTVDTPVLTFESGAVTTPWANAFGSEVSNVETLHTFLGTNSGRINPTVGDLTQPEVVDSYLFDYTKSIDTLINSWTPLASLKIYQIAGVGLPTQTGITYFTDSKCIAFDQSTFSYRCTAYEPKLGFRPTESIDGDETVVTPSALAMSDGADNVERWWLNLPNYNRDSVVNRRHKDIFEVQDVINFIQNTIQGTTSLPYEYLTNTPAVLPDEERLVFSLHSPLDMSIVTEDGREISSSTETIDGAIYKRFGELQHISLPKTSSVNTVRLRGQATGSFTLEIEEKEGDTFIERHAYSAIPSSTSTEVSLKLDETTPIEEAVLEVDYNGDGTLEITYNTEGEIDTEVTYVTLIDAINALSLKSTYKKLLLANAKLAQHYDEKSVTQGIYVKLENLALEALKKQIVFYASKSFISNTEKQALMEIIESLII